MSFLLQLNNILNESTRKGIGYKIINYEDGVASSKANSRLKYIIKPNEVYNIPELWLGTSEQYVKDYYWGGNEDPDDPAELLLTFEFDYDNIIKGNPDEHKQEEGTEFAVNQAILKHAKNLKTDEVLF